MTGSDAPAGFDPHAPGTPEAHWTRVLDDVARPVTAPDLLPPGSDLVVLAAHPDDESLAAGGLLAEAAALGRRAILVVATSGEGSHPRSATHTPAQLAAVREREVTAALRAVHPGALLVLLRLPDGGLAGQRAALAESLAGVVGPRTVLAAPWRRDGHTDHDTAGAVAAEVATAVGATLLEYPVWLWHWGGGSDLAGEVVVRLPLGAEALTRRAAAQAAHVSQVQALSPQAGDEVLLPAHVLERFARPHEVFIASPTRHSATRHSATRHSDAAFDDMFDESDDPWRFESSWYEQRKRAVTLAALPRERLGAVLEVGCSTGVLTSALAHRATTVVGTDVSARAVDRARARLAGNDAVTIRQLRSPQQWPEGSFDLVVLSEVGYFWQPDELDRALALSVGSLTEDGLLLLCHWRHPVDGWPLDGDMVHEAAVGLRGLQVVVSHVETDFRLDVLAAGAWQTPATREGLA